MIKEEPQYPTPDLKVSYYLPAPDLLPFVKYYWIVDIYNAANPTINTIISPSGFPELIFNFGDSVNIDQLVKKNEVPLALIAGQITQPISVVFGDALHCFCVKLQPHALKALFNINSSVFTNNAFDFGIVNPRLRNDLFYQLTEAPNDITRIEHVEGYLRKLLKQNYAKVNQVTISMLDYFRKMTHYPHVSIEELAGCSSRTLQRKIKDDIGISPKMLYRIIRFNKAYHHLKHQPVVKLQDIAFAYGYYDLSHFINEFREFTGQSPLHYFKNQKIINDLFAGIL